MVRRVEVTDFYKPMTETELKGEVLRVAYANGWTVYHVTHAPQRGRQGVGYPDLTLARDGKVVWIELKQEKAAQTSEQIMWMFAIGRPYHVIRPSDMQAGKVHELLS